MKVSTKKYIHREVDHLRRSTKIQSKLNKVALERAEKIMDHRLEGMNEVRGQLETQGATFATKTYVDAEIKLLRNELKSVSRLVYIGVGIVLVLQVIFGGIIWIVIAK